MSSLERNHIDRVYSEKEIWPIPGDKLVCVCLANVGRSPMAEGLIKTIYPMVQTSSAGVADYAQYYPDRTNEFVIQAMAGLGIDISSHKVKQLTPDMVLNADVLVLCDTSLLLTEHPLVPHLARSIIGMPIPDPSDISKSKQTQMGSLQKNIYQTRELLDDLLRNRLKQIMIGVRQQKYKDKTINKVTYPFGIPDTIMDDKRRWQLGVDELFGYPF